jgi:hypothetical protein
MTTLILLLFAVFVVVAVIDIKLTAKKDKQAADGAATAGTGEATGQPCGC